MFWLNGIFVHRSLERNLRADFVLLTMRQLLADPHEALLQQREVHRLREMIREAGALAPRDVLIHAESTERNAGHVFSTGHFTQFAKQIDSGAVRKADITDQDVKCEYFCEIESRGHAPSRLNFVSAAGKESEKSSGRVLVVFHQQDPKLKIACWNCWRSGCITRRWFQL